MNKDDVIVEVRDLRTHFFLHEGIVRAVEGVSFDVYQGRTLGIIGESGSGKSVTAQSIMGIVPSPPAKQIGGEVLLHMVNERGNHEVLDLAALPRTGRQMRAIRGKEIAMIFQEPMTSFSPLHTIGNQIMEGILLHIPDVTKTKRASGPSRCCGGSAFRVPSFRSTPIHTSSAAACASAR